MMATRVQICCTSLQQMAGDEDGFALGSQSVHQVAHLDDTGRVKPIRGFVQDQHIGVLQQGDGNTQALLHAKRVGAHAVFLPPPQADQFQYRFNALIRHAAKDEPTARRLSRPDI